MEQSPSTFKTVGERVKYLQEDILKLTPNKFAKEAGLAYNTLRSLYDSDKEPRRSTIRKILESYDGFVNPAWLIEGKGRPTLSATGEHPAFAKITSDEYWPKAGKLLRKKINNSGKTTEQVAKAAGESKFFIEKTLRGKNSPTPMLMGTLMLQTGTTLDGLAEELGIDVPKKEKSSSSSTSGRKLQENGPAIPVEADELDNGTEQSSQQNSTAVTVQPTNASSSSQATDMGTANATQELRLKIEILANRVAYLEERLARMAQ